MKNTWKLAVLVPIMLLGACSFEVVPPAHKGKILSPSGYEAEILPPGKITTYWREDLVLLETGTGTYREPMTVIMSDKLTLKFEVRFRARIAGSDPVINAMFNDIVPENGRVSLQKVYSTYGQMIVRNKSREVLSKYTVEDVHRNYGRISSELLDAILPAIKGTPLEMSDIALANIEYPILVTEAVEKAKERELDIKREQAQAEIDLTKKENALRLEEADYQIRITRAKAIRDENKLISEGVTPQLLEFRRLEVIEALGKNQNTVFMPVEGLVSPGAQMRIYGK